MEAFVHPLFLARSPVLGGAGHNAVADALGGNPGEILDFAPGVEGVNGPDPLGVDDALDAHLADGLGGLLQGGEEADLQGFPEQRRTDKKLPPGQPEGRDVLSDMV